MDPSSEGHGHIQQTEEATDEVFSQKYENLKGNLPTREELYKKSVSLTSDDASSQLSHSPSSPSEYKFTVTPSEDTPTSEDPNSTSIALKEALKGEKEFIEYVLSLPTTKSGGGSNSSKNSDARSEDNYPVVQSGGGGKVGLDHLDNLCKLMQQLGELKDANVKLQRKLLYLEDMKSLHEMHQELRQSLSMPVTPVTPDTASSCGTALLSSNASLSNNKSAHFAHYQHAPELSLKASNGSNKNSSLSESKKERRHSVHKSKSQVLSNNSSLRRERSKSVGHDELVTNGKTRRKSTKRFPRWSRVKEALGWDKTSQDHETDHRNYKTSRHTSQERASNASEEKYMVSRIFPAKYSGDAYEEYISYDDELDRSSCSGTGHVSADEILIEADTLLTVKGIYAYVLIIQ